MNLMPIYSVPLWQSEYPEFEEHKEIFLDAVRTYKDQNPSVQKSNISGYHSPETLQGVPELRPLFEYLCQLGFKAVGDLDFVDCDIALTSAWLNINDTRQCMNSEHVHGDVFSGVFYLQAPEESGKLVLQNPAINRMWNGCSLTSQKNQFTGESIRIEPVEGNILLFPSYLPHSVETNNHDEERISISFNLIALSKGSIEYSQNQNENKISSAWVGHKEFAEWLVNHMKPEVIVDLGVDWGFSTFCFAMPQIGHVYGIDSFGGDDFTGPSDKNQFEFANSQRKQLSLEDNITFIQGYFDEVAKTWDKKIDILHIDGSHHYEDVKNDFETWSKFVNDGGVILLHDTEVEELYGNTYGVKRFFEEIDLPKCNFVHSYGLGVISKNKKLISTIKKTFDL